MHVDGSYFGERLDKQVEFDDSWMRSGSLVGSLKKNEMCSAKPIVASRLEFPKAPSFDPVEFFDAATAHAYLFPLELAVDHHAYKGEVPRVSVHAAPEQKVALFKKLHQCGRLREVPEHLARDPFVSGLFCVNKNATLDRLILDARPPNLLEPARNYWCSSMASATGLCDIFIPPDVDLCSSGLDLKDFFYQFVVSEQRVERNILSGSLSRAEAEEIFGPCDDRPDEVRVALATLAMGDLLACEFSQEAHLSLCLRYHVFNPGELLTLRTPLPRSKVIAGVIIDDLVVMELLCRQEQLARPHGPDGYNDRIKNALAAYEENDLEANIKKSFFNETCARFWGCEIDGRKGLVRSSTLRAWPLVVITMRVAMLGYSSVKLLETMAGSWINILTMRRRMFCLLDLIFEAMSVGHASSIVALSPALQDELCVISCTFLLACGDLRAGFLPFISATDASCDGMGGVRADLAEEAVMEVARYSLKKSTWTRLLPPEKAALRESAMLDADDGLPGVGISSHPLWSILARCLPYKEKWNTTVATPMHINLLELKAFLIEEQKIASTFYGKRCLSALDSQVCLGALIKGRSSSPGINRMLQRALCYPLGSGLSNYFMYYLSEENRADGPSRKRSPEPPDVAQPLWIDALELGDYGPFDAWISSLSSDFQLQPFDYSSLENGNHTDLRPNSDMPSRQRRRIGRSLKFSTSTASDAASEPQPTSSTTTVGALPSSCISVGDLCRSETRSSPETGVREPSVAEGALESDNVAPSLGQGKKTLSDLKKMKYGGLLEHFSLDQFVFKGDFPDLDQPGALDLFSGSLGVAKQMALHGAPWILTFDWDRSPAEDLLQVSLREKLVASIRSGFFRSVGMAPICASFSKAVTPPVRTNRFPRGKPGLSKNMRKKVSEGNSHADFCALLISICIEMKISYFLENPDSSWMWRLKGRPLFYSTLKK